VYRGMGAAEGKIPRFSHVPLVVGLDGKRLAKRHGESRIAQFRSAGVSPEKVVGWVAWRSGQIAEPREMGVGEVLAGFDVKKLPRERVVLGEADLGWLR
jgi:glutamyl-tRNA synthetase